MSVQHVAADLTPIGGLPQAAGEPADTDDEGMFKQLLRMSPYNIKILTFTHILGGIEDSDDSDSRDEEEDDDEMDAIDANIANTNNSAVTIDTSSPDIFNQPQYQ